MGAASERGIDPAGMITEWMAGYPSQNIQGGEKHTSYQSYYNYARINDPDAPDRDVGIEICFDHGQRRLRRSVDMKRARGAGADNFPISKQFVISAGMNLRSQCLAIGPCSYSFNADGLSRADQFPPDKKDEPARFKNSANVYVLCGSDQQAPEISTDGQTHYSHSQLATTTPNSQIKGYDNALGFHNLRAKTYEETPPGPDGEGQIPYNYLTDKFDIHFVDMAINMSHIHSSSRLFCSGFGKLHVYTTKGIRNIVAPRHSLGPQRK